jgi:hypothetical protein
MARMTRMDFLNAVRHRRHTRDARSDVLAGNRRMSYLFISSVIRAIRGELYLGSRLLFLAELLESGIAAQGVPDRIEPKKGRRNGRWVVKPATIGRL